MTTAWELTQKMYCCALIAWWPRAASKQILKTPSSGCPQFSASCQRINLRVLRGIWPLRHMCKKLCPPNTLSCNEHPHEGPHGCTLQLPDHRRRVFFPCWFISFLLLLLERSHKAQLVCRPRQYLGWRSLLL